jgi:fibronectin type 3 domain-containing protein
MKKNTIYLIIFFTILIFGNLLQIKITIHHTEHELMATENDIPFIEVPSIVSEIKSYSSGLSYSTYFGGSESDSNTYITLDKENNVWITGATTSPDFPTTTNAYNRTHGGADDIFVSKFDGKNGSLLYSTFIGGTGYEVPFAIKIDANQNIWVCGETGSSNFPITLDANAKVLNGSVDAFLFKLSGINGSLLYSTFIGGSGGDSANALELDVQNNVWLTGMTTSSDFPMTSFALYPEYNGSIDVFLCQFLTNGSMGYSTFLGGNDADYGHSLAFTSSGDIWVTGETWSMNFPLTSNANDSILSGSSDIFLTKLTGNGTNLSYSTFIGGGSTEASTSIVVDFSGDIWMTGYTTSSNFPTTPFAYDSIYGGSYDAFLLKFAGNESKYLYSSYLGGNNQDHGRSVHIDTNGYIWLSGETLSDPFPTTPNAYNSTYSGFRDAFILALAPNETLAYSTYVGGSDREVFTDLALDPTGKVWISGETKSLNFPTTSNAYNRTYSGNNDIFLFSLTLYSTPHPPFQLSVVASSEQDALLTWKRPQYEGNSPIITYRVYRNSTPIFDSHLTETPFEYYIDETVMPEITYYYTITAINSFGESQFATMVSLTIIPTLYEPSAPQNFIGINETNYIYLTWDIPINDGGTPIISYTIYRREMCGTYSLLDTTTETFFTDASVNEGTTYLYKVTATNNVGEGAASNEITIKIKDTTPPIISHPNDLEVNEGTSDQRITWYVSDNNPTSFIITRNNILLISAPWNGENISIGIDMLLAGTYLYNCTVIDQAGNSASDLVEVRVTIVPSSITSTSTTTTSSISKASPGYTFFIVFIIILSSIIFRRKVE